jgi:aminoglycoside 6'-N-acetyltransferase
VTLPAEPLVQRDIIVSDADVVIRRMRDDDSEYIQMAHWRNLPHVRRWWDHDLPLATLESMKQEYQPDTAPDAVSVACFIDLRDKPIGFIQFYRWASYPDEVAEAGIPIDDSTYGLDVFIGDHSQMGRGVGTRVVSLLSDYLIDELGASAVCLTTDIDNHVAQRCYEKAGFSKVKQVLDTDTYKGERVLSWLMEKRRP